MAAKLLGRARACVLGQPFATFVLPEDVAMFQRRCEAFAASSQTSVCEIRIRRADGSWFWARLDFFSAPSVSVTCRWPVRFTLWDVTDYQHAKELLRFHKMWIDEDGATMKVGGWQLDVATGEGSWTDGVARIYDLDPSAPTNRDIGIRFFPDESRPIIEKAVDSAIKFARPYDLELELVSAKGVRKWIRTIGHPVEENGRVVRVAGSFQDITERKRAEVERNNFAAQLQQAQRVASIGRLAGGVAHDFNNLLTSIMAHVELCRDELGVDSPVEEYLVEIMNAAQCSAGIVRQLLSLARKQAVMPEVLDLNEHIARTLTVLQRLIGENIDLVWLPQARRARVNVDPAQIDQILTNLIVNARDAITGNGTITVETMDTTLDADYCAEFEGMVSGDYVVVSVCDTGVGMTPEVQPHIFEPFFLPRRMRKAPDWGWPQSMTSSNRTTGILRFTANRAMDRPFGSFSPVTNRPKRFFRKSRNRLRPAGRKPYFWSRTKEAFGLRPRCFSGSSAMWFWRRKTRKRPCALSTNTQAPFTCWSPMS